MAHIRKEGDTLNAANWLPSVVISLEVDLMKPQFTLQLPSLGCTQPSIQDGAFYQALLLGQVKHVAKLSHSSGVSNIFAGWSFIGRSCTKEGITCPHCSSFQLNQVSPLLCPWQKDTEPTWAPCSALWQLYSALRTVKLLPEPVLILAAVELLCQLINVNEKQGAKLSVSSWSLLTPQLMLTWLWRVLHGPVPLCTC